jgi:acyl carrier protein
MQQMTSGPNDTMTLDEALGWIAEMFEEPKANVAHDTARSSIAAWDSLGQLILMSALDQRFGIRLKPAELSNLNSVQDVLDILTSNERLRRVSS